MPTLAIDKQQKVKINSSFDNSNHFTEFGNKGQ